MGVQKTLEFKNTGIDLSYWRINCVEVDTEINRTKIRVGGYVNKTDALAGKKAVHHLHYIFTGAENPISWETDPREYQNILYAKLIEETESVVQNKLVGGLIVSDLP
jgi:hypothetical protein